MIAKILKSSNSFSGVSYNEKKIAEGKAVVLEVNNFDLYVDDISTKDYINYMKLVCNTNTNVANKQFHAVISCEGREFSPAELKIIAHDYLYKMGYGNNPYLIYFHADTDNNHVHIVSTRVDKQGKKINDRFEKVRSLNTINQIMSIDITDITKRDCNIAMQYQFSTINQFKLILEQKGYNITDTVNEVNVIKGGSVQMRILKSEISKKCTEYSCSQDRKNQIKALIHKYKTSLSYNELSKLLKDKFGLQLILHTGKNKTTPYGYTIIDHHHKTVHKGGDIFPLRELMIQPKQHSKINECNGIVHGLLQNAPNKDFFEMKEKLEGFGYSLKYNGDVRVIGAIETVLTLDFRTIENLRYNSRLKEASLYVSSSIKMNNFISHFFYINEKDLHVILDENYKPNINLYRDIINSSYSNNIDVVEILKRNNIDIAKSIEGVFLVDRENKYVINIGEIPLNSDVERKLVNELKYHSNGDVLVFYDKENVDNKRSENITKNLMSPNLTEANVITDNYSENLEKQATQDINHNTDLGHSISNVVMNSLKTEAIQTDSRKKKRKRNNIH